MCMVEERRLDWIIIFGLHACSWIACWISRKEAEKMNGAKKDNVSDEASSIFLCDVSKLTEGMRKLGCHHHSRVLIELQKGKTAIDVGAVENLCTVLDTPIVWVVV